MYSPISGTGDGSAPVVNLTFDFIEDSHVKAAVEGVEVPFTWTSASQITFDSSVALNDEWVVYRDTPISSALVDFTDGSYLTEDDLDRSQRQLLYRQQELEAAGVSSSPNFDNVLKGEVTGAGIMLSDAASAEANGDALTDAKIGPGQITTADGNKRGKQFTNVTSAPASTADGDDIETAFNGDFMGPFVVEHRISGANTLGTPATGYLYSPAAYPFYGVMENLSGHNEATDSNVGRTAAAFFRADVKNYGQGDGVVFNATGIAAGSKAGATHFLANPAIVLFNGDVHGGSDGVYLNPREIIMHDNGFDVAGLGDVINLNRTNATGGLSAWWGAYRAQSVGSEAVNNVLSATGKFGAGLDLSLPSLDLGVNKVAIAIKADDLIYLNASSSNGDYMDTPGGWSVGYSSAADAISVQDSSGSSVVQFANDKLNSLVPVQIPTITSAELPAAAPENKGMRVYISDATSTTRHAAAVGGGANWVLVESDGSGWRVA